MAKTNFQDPGSSEIRSTHISGIMEAVNKIEESLNMDTVAETDVVLPELFISEDDRYRIFQAPEGKRNWLNSPAPVIKKNGVVISTGFGIDYGGGAVVFNPPLTASDTVTASFTRTKNTSGFNKHLADKVHIGNNPYVSVRHNLDQSIPHNTATILEFNTLNFDNDEMYNAAEPTKITIKTTGKYLIEYKGEWSANATGVRQAEIYWNRAGVFGRKRINATANGGTTVSAMTVVSLYENDYIEIRVYQNSGGALNIINAPTISSYLTVVKVG